MTYGATQSKQDEIIAALGARGATSQPLAGAAAASTSAGPFTPQLARAIWLTLTGAWTGTVRVLRSVDGGATKVPLTLAGQSWASFTANCAEPIAEESVSAATYYLDIALTSGAVTYRLEQ